MYPNFFFAQQMTGISISYRCILLDYLHSFHWRILLLGLFLLAAPGKNDARSQDNGTYDCCCLSS